ncbi:MAG: hypothetical protein GY953_35635 [bacterium]|nr:hypothetical protein [bacterium]
MAGDCFPHPDGQFHAWQNNFVTYAGADQDAPTRKEKTAGLRGARLWVKIRAPSPMQPSEPTFLVTDTRTPYVAEFVGLDANKVAQYMQHWENTSVQSGPSSEAASATIRTYRSMGKQSLPGAHGRFFGLASPSSCRVPPRQAWSSSRPKTSVY